MRENISLNYEWKFSDSFSERQISASFDDTDFVKVDLPHNAVNIPINHFDEKIYQIVSCYRKKIHIIKQDNLRYALNFDAVGHIATVYVNGTFAGEHFGGYTAFEINITSFIQSGDNIIVVKVDSTENSLVPPFGGTIDYLTFGGIYGEVSLIVTSESYIENLFLYSQDCMKENKTIVAEAEIVSPAADGWAILSVYDGDILVASGKSKIAEKMRLQADYNFELWGIDSPKLYRVELLYMQGENIVDKQTRMFGLREAIFKSDGFYLNGNKIKLIGLNRHQSFPYVGYAMPKYAQQQDARILKNELCVNLVRTSHYPQSKHFLDECDKLGLLVFAENAGWQYVGDKAWQDNYCITLKEMILQERNHASIILLGVRVNESGDYSDFYKRTNKIAHSIDPTRQTGGVRCFKNSELLEDVYTFNDFVFNGSGTILQNKNEVTSSNSPYLVTEFNGHMFPTKKFDNDIRRQEHALRFAKILSESNRRSDICGCIGWCMCDYNTHKDFGSGDKICYHGVMDIFRLPKIASALYSSQSETNLTMQVASSLNIGEYDNSNIGGVYVFTNCDYIQLVRNGQLIGNYYPDVENFSGLKHPPIYMDLMGDTLVNYENFSDNDARKIKNFLKLAGLSSGISNMDKDAEKILDGVVTAERAWNLYGKYAANWGSENIKYEIKGYKDGKFVKNEVFDNSSEIELKVIVDKNILTMSNTYDVAKITLIAARDSRPLNYCFDALELLCEGSVKIIGEKVVSLISGERAFWVQSTCVGHGKVTIKSEKYGTRLINFMVEKGESL